MTDSTLPVLEITAPSGTTIVREYDIVDADGAAADVSGAQHRALIKRSRDDPDDEAIAKFDVQVAQASPSTVTIRLAADDNTLEPGIYVADHRVRWGAADEYIVAEFVIRITQPVTRSAS